MQQLSATDAAFLGVESPRTPNHLCITNIYDPSTAPGGQVSFEQIVEAVRANLGAAPPFRRRLVRVPLDLDHPYWVEDSDFDLEFHMRHIALPSPGDWSQFRTQVARLASRPLDLARPPWEMTVIAGLDAIEGLPPGCFATVLKVHHAAIDGQAGVELVSAIHDPTPTPRTPPPDEWKPERIPSDRELLRRAAAHGVTRPIEMARLLSANAVPIVREIPERLRGDRRNQGVPDTRLNGKVSAHRVWDHISCDIADVKRMRSLAEGATVNDVCLAIVAEALRTYLLSKDELPEESLVTMVPISTRTPDQAGEGGNQITMMRPLLHTDIADPVERLAAITATTRQKKAAQDGVIMPLLLDVAQQLPGALVGVATRAMSGGSAPVVANTIVTNVPGVREPMYFLGAEWVMATGCVPLTDGIGLFHCVSSYVDRFAFMYTACRDLLPDADFYSDCLREAIATYRDCLD